MGFMYILALRFGDFVPSVYTLIYEGLAQDDHSIFSPNYGNWKPHDEDDNDMNRRRDVDITDVPNIRDVTRDTTTTQDSDEQ